MFKLCGCAVSWKSKRQPTIATSTTEAEYMAAYFGGSEAIWLRSLLGELGCTQSEPTKIYSDNQACISITKNPTLKSCAKHISIKYHFLRERISTGELLIGYIRTENEIADILTKALAKPQFENLRDQMGIRSVDEIKEKGLCD